MIKPRLTSYGFMQEGTGPERKWLVIKLVTESDRVVERKVIETTRWRDVAEDSARRALWGKAS